MHTRALFFMVLLALPALHGLTAQAPPDAPAPMIGTAAPAAPTLTRAQAEALALKNNPRVSISKLLAQAQHEVVRESRSGELPLVNGSLTAVETNTGSRLPSGSLTDSSLFEHAGGGILLSQLITDFGRSANLVASAKLGERAQQANALATAGDVLLVTDQAFYDALEAQAVLQVTQQTIATRQATQQQISQLTQNNLRSTLDLTFANVDLSQARLLQLDAANHAAAAVAALDEVLGLDRAQEYTLVDDPQAASAPPPPPPDVQPLIRMALEQRPDLGALDLNRQSLDKLSRAQSDQRRPTISALGTVGGTPVRPGEYFRSSWDGAIGANVNIPIFNGFLYSAEAKETGLRASAAAEQTRQLRDRIVRDVQTAWLQANTAYQRIGLTAQLLNQANQSLSLAQTRYQLGLSSIVELSQAQLQQTQAAIGHTNAQYQYRLTAAALDFEVGEQAGVHGQP